jgi:hypothetical protein
MNLQSLIDDIKKEFPFVDIFASETSTHVELHTIKLPPEMRNKGIGSTIIRKLQDYAKMVQKPIVLIPEPERGKKASLDKFYKSLGFVKNKGRNKDYRLSKPFAPTMYWKNFKEWLDEKYEINPPAIVQQAEHPASRELKELQKAIDQTIKIIDNILNIFSFNETASYWISKEVEDYVIPNKDFQEYLANNFKASLNSNGIGYPKSCGEDGCAYFCSNKIVIKFSRDHKEFDIANRVKGNLKLLPILDAVEWEIEETESVVYSITMKELITDVFQISKSMRAAGNLVAGTCYQLQTLVNRKPYISTEYVRKRLSVAYMLKDSMIADESVKDAIRDFVRVLRLIYDKSGMLVGADWENGRNYGLSPKKKVMPFDLGRPDIHTAAKEQLPEVPRKTMTLSRGKFKEWITTMTTPHDDSVAIQLQNAKDGKPTGFQTYGLPKSRKKRITKGEEDQEKIPCPLCKTVQPFPGQDTNFDQSNIL